MIAVLGGSFNPVHLGHLQAAEAVLKKTKANEVWFLPCHFHPFKKNKEFVSDRERIEMLRLALKGKQNMKLSLFEINLGKKTRRESRTLATVKALRKKYPKKEFAWIIGSNLVREIKKWAEFEELISLIQFIVVPIKESKNWRKEKWLKENKAVILRQEIEDVSSTKIRCLIKQGKTVREFLPEKVFGFVAENNLYLPENSFTKRVYSITASIPSGKISSYGEIARASGSPKAARAVGNLMNKNPFSPIVPCHRVVLGNGEIGGFASGSAKKRKLLESEGITVKNGKIEDFHRLIVKAQKLRKLRSEN